MQNNISVYHITLFTDAPILKMHWYGQPGGSTETVDSETEATKHGSSCPSKSAL